MPRLRFALAIVWLAMVAIALLAGIGYAAWMWPWVVLAVVVGLAVFCAAFYVSVMINDGFALLLGGVLALLVAGCVLDPETRMRTLMCFGGIGALVLTGCAAAHVLNRESSAPTEP